ncbi:hypothetical protein [Planotetraspora phitsanulokensis]|uniref:Uncharacterized protein n=1 Tax=Planotetraspora phitsanulokensis TaxID=575192 RepID=A0A8J3XMR7_9ACTN|nr:hypothetical protein [Planotetraspora phitsanulokensis]GII42003.1 hypothetical protein Pph01_70060 [Planotetraspora phitsanulokensis]
MAIEMRPSAATAVAGADALDYYLVLPDRPADGTPADGIVVEEFALGSDHTAIGLDCAGWTAADGEWWSSAAFSRGMRREPDLRRRVAAVPRRDAEVVYRRLGGGELPGEAELRSRFHDREPLGEPPLLLGSPDVPDGFHDRRLYRVLFAGDLAGEGLARLRALWRMTLPGDFADPRARVAGTATLSVAGDLFSWDLRRIGPGVAWCLDLTACLAGPADAAVRPLLRELTTVMRYEGLIPVTIERFS